MIYHISTTVRDTTHAQRIISALSDRGIARARLTIGVSARNGGSPMDPRAQVPLTITTTDADEVAPLKELLTYAGGIHTVCPEESGCFEAV